MKNKFESYIKRNLILSIICIIAILGLTVGYSILYQDLAINSRVTLRADKDIRISSVSDYISTGGGYEIYNNTYTENTFTSNLELPNLDSTVTYSIVIDNKGLKNMKISDINFSIFNNDNMTYRITGANVNTVIESNTFAIMNVTFKYKTSVTVVPENKNIGSIIEVNFEEYIPVDDYVANGVLLDLRGTEQPESMMWVDNRNGKSLSLANVIYDSTEKIYDFSGNNAFATLGEPIIPETGDFTLEVYAKSPSVFNTDADEAIVAQVSDISNDTGRFKVNLKNDSVSTGLLVFYNSQTPANTNSKYFLNPVETSTKYLMQVVRSGETLKLYLNGNLVSTNAYNSTNIISQGPFKLGKWNEANLQYYTGSIHAVRLYNRALSTSELIKNRDVDMIKYDEPISGPLKAYAFSNQIVSSGEGLYNVGTNIYKYKGIGVNNYIKFLGDGDLYRIISFNDDNTIKIINATVDISTAYDAPGNRIYDPVTSSYCTAASTETTEAPIEYKGCNYFGTTTDYNGLTVSVPSSAKQLLDTWWDALPSRIKEYVVSYVYNTGFINPGSTPSQVVSRAANITYEGYCGLPEVKDIIEASVVPISNINTSSSLSNYMINISNETTGYWTLNGLTTNSFDMWAVAFGRQLGSKRASRTFQKSDGKTAYFKMKPVMYIRDDLIVSGLGTSNSPFIILE